jgi:hypothetical protein
VRRRGVRFVLFVLPAALGAACGAGQDPSLPVPTTAPTSVGAPSTTPAAADFEVELSGATVVPGPGDDDGTGTARLRLVPERSEVCYEIEVAGIEPPTGAHIHQAPAGEAGDVVLDVSPSTSGPWEGCVAANQVLLEQVASDPSGFYVNVHTADLPNGALRGQLS